jgi:hypothetical protein
MYVCMYVHAMPRSGCAFPRSIITSTKNTTIKASQRSFNTFVPRQCCVTVRGSHARRREGSRDTCTNRSRVETLASLVDELRDLKDIGGLNSIGLVLG